MPMETAPPKLVLIAGPNGSGKSTITRKLMASGADFGVYINPDEIARQLDGNDMLNARRAQELAEEQRNELSGQEVISKDENGQLVSEKMNPDGTIT